MRLTDRCQLCGARLGLAVLRWIWRRDEVAWTFLTPLGDRREVGLHSICRTCRAAANQPDATGPDRRPWDPAAQLERAFLEQPRSTPAPGHSAAGVGARRNRRPPNWWRAQTAGLTLAFTRALQERDRRIAQLELLLVENLTRARAEAVALAGEVRRLRVAAAELETTLSSQEAERQHLFSLVEELLKERGLRVPWEPGGASIGGGGLGSFSPAFAFASGTAAAPPFILPRRRPGEREPVPPGLRWQIRLSRQLAVLVVAAGTSAASLSGYGSDTPAPVRSSRAHARRQPEGSVTDLPDGTHFIIRDGRRHFYTLFPDEDVFTTERE